MRARGANVTDSVVLAVAAKTYWVPDAESDFPKHFPSEVVVTLKSGRVIRCRMATSLGSPDRPMSRDALLAKFVLNASRAIPRDQAETIAQLVLAIDHADSLEPLVALCTMR